MGRLLRGAGLLLALLLLTACIALAWAHVAIRSLRPELPGVEQVQAAAEGLAELPVRLTVLNTARQAMPRSAVLAPSRDPHPERGYVMAFPAFLLEWADGRGLLIDAGMDRDEALSFGRPLELLAGAGPIEPLAPLAEQLGPRAAGPLALLFTHLHNDHTQGSVALCARRAPGNPPVRVYQGTAQATRGNHTTRLGTRPLAEAPCLRFTRLDDQPLAPVPGHPGVFVIRAAGHTPGSQVVVAFVRHASGTTGYVFSGDVVNHVDGVRAGVPKPWLYRLLVVPESDSRLAEMRAFLRLLERAGLRLVVSHDLEAIESLGLPSTRSGPAPDAAEVPAGSVFAPVGGA